MCGTEEYLIMCLHALELICMMGYISGRHICVTLMLTRQRLSISFYLIYILKRAYIFLLLYFYGDWW